MSFRPCYPGNGPILEPYGNGQMQLVAVPRKYASPIRSTYLYLGITIVIFAIVAVLVGAFILDDVGYMSTGIVLTFAGASVAGVGALL